MFVVSSIDVEDEKDKMWLMGCVVKEERCGWMLRNSSGTYRVVVIRPQLSRTATASKGYTSNSLTRLGAGPIAGVEGREDTADSN